jgi:hypothetical protein
MWEAEHKSGTRLNSVGHGPKRVNNELGGWILPFTTAPLDDVNVEVQAATRADQRRASSIRAAVTSQDAGPPISSARPTSDVVVPFFPSHSKPR